MKTYLSAKNSFLRFAEIFPHNDYIKVYSGITTREFGDCNYHGAGGTEDGVKHLGRALHATEIFTPYPKHGIVAIEAELRKGIKKSEGVRVHRGDGDAVILRHNIFKGRSPLLVCPTADCPIVLIHGKKVSAIIHTGRRGLELQIISQVVSDLRSRHLLKRAEAKVVIWPGICQEDYEVSEEVAVNFPDETVNRHLNMAAVIKKELLLLNFSTHNIGMPKFCSFHSKENGEYLFSSFRRGDQYARNLVFMLVDLSV